jgi:hypothetical protein
VYTDEYGIETDGFTDENEDSVIATIDEKDKVLTTTYTSSTRVTSPVVAVTSYFDSIVAVVALVATVFGIYELSTICATAVATASSSNTSSYPEQLNIPVYLLLTAIVGAITLTVAILLLRRPIGTSIGDSNEANDTSIHKICKPAGESEHYYETQAQTAVVGDLQFLVTCVPQLPAQVQPCVPLLTSIDALLPSSTH